MNQIAELLIGAALKAPSGDNCQPFVFQIAPNDTILILHVESRARHFMNMANSTSLLVLGMVLESMVIEASGLGCGINIELYAAAGSDKDARWAQVHFFSAPSNQIDPLVGALDVRHTNRDLFEKSAPPSAVLDQMTAEARRGSSDTIAFFSKPSGAAFLKYLKTCEVFLWKHQPAALDFLKMVRFNRQEYLATKDGISVEELGAKPHEVVSLKLMRRFPFIIPFFYYTGLRMILRQVADRSYRHSGGYVIFCVDQETPTKNAMINVGRSSLRVWLYLSQQSYAVQPATTSSLLSFLSQRSTLRGPIQPKYLDLFPRSQALWTESFKLPANLQTVWAFRIGKPKVKKQPLSIRQDLKDVISYTTEVPAPPY